MTESPSEPSSQLGLLDLSVDLSVPEVFSGSEFTVYLHVKNPFAWEVWIRSVELSLPAQLSARDHGIRGDNRKSRDPADANEKLIRRSIKRRGKEIQRLQAQLIKMEHEGSKPIQRRLSLLDEENNADVERLRGLIGGEASISADDNSTIRLGRAGGSKLSVSAHGSSTIVIDDFRQAAGTLASERVPLSGSLPQGAALQPGSTDVWTIRLGSSRNPFFIPARYRLQLTVIYTKERAVDDDPNQDLAFFSNTVALTIPVRTALWSVISGGALGGALGSLARSLQNVGSVDRLGEQSGAIFTALALAIVLSGAAVVFAARKSEAQSFVTVEDFWGGLVVGFLIGYSGTDAFTKVTGISSAKG
jgi:hypothetical protein